MKARTIFTLLLITIIALTGLMMITVTGCNSPGTAGVPPALPKINPEIRNQAISIVYSLGKIAATTYINKMVTDGKLTADEATTYKQIVSNIKLPSPTAPEVTATPGTAGVPPVAVQTHGRASLPAANTNNDSSGAAVPPDNISP